MKCYDPVLCYKDDNGKRHFRHFSLANHVFKFYQHQQVFNCGKCLFCRKKKAYELACRCVLHASMYEQNCFVTLTYNGLQPGFDNSFDYRDIQLFKKRLRQSLLRSQNKRVEIFNVHEYGKQGRKHWHLVIFNHDFADKEPFTKSNQIPIYTSKTLEKLWPHGFNAIGDVTEASAMYQAQYMKKDFKNGNVTNDKKSHSKHSGIGKPYFLKHYNQILRLGYIPINGKKLPIPRYFQKIAHKHWSHFYCTENFFDHWSRKKLYTPFKQGQENKEIADLYIDFKNQKDIKILELEKEWEEVISQLFHEDKQPDFIQAGKNALHDLSNKKTTEKF